jgi:nucleoside-diphosphate-sugar epimerase
MKKICAITGSNGYVGSAVKKYFAARGWEILELTRRPGRDFRAAAFQLGDDVSPELLVGVTALVHCAYDFAPLRREEIHAVNVEGSRKIFAAAQAAGVPKIIFISSISAFSGCRSLYGQAKLAIEKIALDHGALVIRPGLVHGEDAGGMFGRLAAQIQNSALVPLIGGGRQIQFLVHADDLAGFVEKVAAGKIEIEPQVLTAAHPQPWLFKDLLLAVARAQDKKINFLPVPWRIMWCGLKIAEAGGLKLNFRSDSLVSLMHQNPAPDFSANEKIGLACRPFPSQA